MAPLRIVSNQPEMRRSKARNGSLRRLLCGRPASASTSLPVGPRARAPAANTDAQQAYDACSLRACARFHFGLCLLPLGPGRSVRPLGMGMAPLSGSVFWLSSSSASAPIAPWTLRRVGAPLAVCQPLSQAFFPRQMPPHGPALAPARAFAPVSATFAQRPVRPHMPCSTTCAFFAPCFSALCAARSAAASAPMRSSRAASRPGGSVRALTASSFSSSRSLYARRTASPPHPTNTAREFPSSSLSATIAGRAT